MNIINKNKVRMAFRNYPSLYPILEHKAQNVLQDIRDISKEDLIIVYNGSSGFYELHNLDKFNRDLDKEYVPSTYETTLPIEVTQITNYVTKWIFSKDQTRNDHKKYIEFGEQIKEEIRQNRKDRAVKQFANVFYA